jgi:hypothetical protein
MESVGAWHKTQGIHHPTKNPPLPLDTKKRGGGGDFHLKSPKRRHYFIYLFIWAGRVSSHLCLLVTILKVL